MQQPGSGYPDEMPVLCWKNLEVRLILDEACPASFNMARDEAILEGACRGLGLPTLRFYRWSPPAVSLGYFQRSSMINMEKIRLHGLQVVRRPTGGRALLHDRELTCSLVLPLPGGERLSILESFLMINSGFVRGLQELGVDARLSPRRSARGVFGESPACFQALSSFEIECNGRKLMGSAQVRRQGFLLVQGSIPLKVDRDLLLEILWPAFPKAGWASRKALEDSMTSLIESLGEEPEAGMVIDYLLCGLHKYFGWRFCPGHLTREEMRLQDALLSKYEDDSWNFRL